MDNVKKMLVYSKFSQYLKKKYFIQFYHTIIEKEENSSGCGETVCV